MNPHYTYPPQALKTVTKISYWRVFLLLSIFLVLVVLGVYGYRTYIAHPPVAADVYKAVFMQNGQVYFGKISGEENGYVTLEKVYYVQTPNQNPTAGVGATTGTEISLVRLGSELHAPESKMYINKDQIMFYQDLRKDSQVLQSILSNEQK